MNKSRYEEVEEEEEDDQYLQYNEKQDCANKTINHAARREPHLHLNC